MNHQKLQESLQRIGNDIEEDSFSRQENAQPHNTREQAEFLLEQFFTLSVEELEKLFTVSEFDSKLLYSSGTGGVVPGRLADDPFRSMKNLFISALIMLATELQHRFPTDYELITTMSDACVREVERAKTEEDLLTYGLASILTLKTRLLGAGASTFYHPLVKQAKDYIYQNLHRKIQLGELAELLGTTPSYLSQLFRKYEGMTPQQFIMHERLRRAKNLLVYTDRSVDDIGHSLGFSTTSYFGKCLKAETNLTPLQYRERFSEEYRKKTKNRN